MKQIQITGMIARNADQAAKAKTVTAATQPAVKVRPWFVLANTPADK